MNARQRGLAVVLGAGVLLSAGAYPAAAQLVSDRPDFTESTVTVPDGRFQIEAGYTYTKVNDQVTLHRIGEALLRYGLIPGLELRVGAPSLFSIRGELGPFEDEESGIGDASVGMKLGLYEAGMSEGLPSLSLLLGTGIPLGDDVFGADGFEPEAVLALGWALAPRLDLGANVRYTQRDQGGRYDELGASVSLGLPLTSSIGAFIEYYAIRPDLDADNVDEDVIDGGVTFLVNPTLQLDGRIGFGVGDSEDMMFFGFGLAKLF